MTSWKSNVTSKKIKERKRKKQRNEKQLQTPQLNKCVSLDTDWLRCKKTATATPAFFQFYHQQVHIFSAIATAGICAYEHFMRLKILKEVGSFFLLSSLFFQFVFAFVWCFSSFMSKTALSFQHLLEFHIFLKHNPFGLIMQQHVAWVCKNLPKRNTLTTPWLCQQQNTTTI